MGGNELKKSFMNSFQKYGRKRSYNMRRNMAYVLFKIKVT
jgi:hypothetical protein